MEQQPLVSVIITCYNYGAFVDEAINSVLEQTYGAIELIVINDGSTDNSDAIISRAIKDQKRAAIYLKQENLGVVMARNKGLEAATGGFLLFLDADDYLPANYVERLVDLAQERHVDVVYADFKRIDSAEEDIVFPEYSSEIIKNRNFVSISSLVRKSVIGTHRFDEFLNRKSHEDYDFFLGLALSGARFAKSTSTALFYRQHADARNNDFSDDAQRARYAEVYEYIITKYRAAYEGELWYLSGFEFALWYQHLNAAYDAVLASRSYRLGNALLRPLRFIKGIFGR